LGLLRRRGDQQLQRAALRGRDSWALHGTLVNFDAFKIRQRNLVFIAPHKDGEWRWPVRAVDLGEGFGPRELRATLGPQLPEMIVKG
jgi:hypothetical protein